MANLKTALDTVMIHEGGYVNDPVDPGGETYAGVARRYWPNWAGWAFIDTIRDKSSLHIYAKMEEYVELFYREQFWNRLQGDKITSQAVADELLDSAVNLGVHQAVKFLQIALNVLNRNGTAYENVVVDGELGPKTLTCLATAAKTDEKLLVKVMNVLQGGYYLEKMQESEIKERFARGWFNRVLL